MDEENSFLIVPTEQLSADALQGIIEEFITREGTDYGDVELSLAEKAEQIRLQLRKGLVVVVFDILTESCTMMTREDAERVA
ncbi:MAG: hypothetical protein JWM78_2571 [Verrucomicrobiaceae bacterium]|nr:hypothetical protein [Verrucomicrobiaceae bacterium]